MKHSFLLEGEVAANCLCCYCWNHLYLLSGTLPFWLLGLNPSDCWPHAFNNPAVEV